MLDASKYGASRFGAEVCPANFWTARTPFNPAKPTAGTAIAVFANEGRWIASCHCGGAQLASYTDPRFMCTECANFANGGCWLPLFWPANRDAIEVALSARHPVNQNWLPGETVAQLILENAAMKVAS